MMFAVPAAINLANADTVLQQGLRAINGGATEFDFSALANVDSAAVCVLLAWRRAAKNALTWRNLPANLQSLAELYGVADFFAAK